MSSAFVAKRDKIESQLLTKCSILHAGKRTNVIAQWDTGAEISCISHQVVSTINPTRYGSINLFTPTGVDKRDTYRVDIILPNDVMVEKVIVSDSEIGNQGIGLLIGMDIISKGDFAVTHYCGKTVFSFRTPSSGILDFVAGVRFGDVISGIKRHGNGRGKHNK